MLNYISNKETNSLQNHLIKNKRVPYISDSNIFSLFMPFQAFLQRIRQTAEDQQCLTSEQVKILFSNIEEILDVHREVLSALEAILQPEPQHHHALGHVFLQFVSHFSVYGEYCSNHEKALKLLIELNKIPHIRTFLLVSNNTCFELLKRTPKKHTDYPAVEEALQAMKEVCSNINETKRQMEKLEALEQLQSHIEGWEGTNLTDICTELLLHGNLLKISAGNIQERVFFLFDNLLVYCKRKSRVSGKKSTKRTKSINGPLYVFRGRINTEVMEVENVEDGTGIRITSFLMWFCSVALYCICLLTVFAFALVGLKLGMERDAYVMIAEKGEKLYHMMMTKSRHLIKDRRRKLSIVPKCFLGNKWLCWQGLRSCMKSGSHWISDKHQFKNEQVLYRFRYDDGTYKARSEMEDIVSKGVRLYCRLHSLFTPVIKDRDHHLKTFKSVLPASKLVDWLLSQGDCSTREDAVTLGVGLCNNGFMHHVLEKSEFKDESQFFRFYADEETEGTSAKSKQLRNDFKLIENILVKSLLIHPEEEDYGFEIEEKNKAIVVKSVTRGSYAEMAGLQAGKKIYSINEDLVFLRPFSEVETMINQSFCIRRSLRLLVSTKNKELVKVPDCRDGLSFKLSGSSPPYVHAVKKGERSLLVFQKQHVMVSTSISEFMASTNPGTSFCLSADAPLVNLMVDNVHLEHGVVYEYVSTAGIKHHVLEKMVEPKGCFSLTAKILEAFAKDDDHFVTCCSHLIAQSDRVVSMPQYEFRNICDTKLESIQKRICSYRQVTARKHPLSHFKLPFTVIFFLPTLSYTDILWRVCGPQRVKRYFKLSEYNQVMFVSVCGFSECNSNRDSVLSYTSVRSNSSYLGSDEMGSGDELPCDMQIPLDKQDKLHGCLEHLFNQVDSINSLLKGQVMSKACEETKHFHPDHSQPEFRHTDDWTARCRYILHKNIQEDPWNLPSSIKNLVDSLHGFVEDGRNQLLLALLKCTDTCHMPFYATHCQELVITLCQLAMRTLASREERTSLEDTKAALLDLDKVTVLFRSLENECLVANTPVHYQVEGSRQAIRVTLYLDSCHFSELPIRLQNGGSLKLHSVLFSRALERPEGAPTQDFVAMEEFQQRINAVSLEKVKFYYRRLSRAIWPPCSRSDRLMTPLTFLQLLRPLNTLDDLCRLMQTYMNVRPSAAGHPSGVSVLLVSSELCSRLGACHITMCSTGLQRCTLTTSLEQAMNLARNHGLMPRCFMQAMDIMRKQGTRVEISAKNLKVMDQMPAFAPRLFKLCLPPSDGDL
uniref:Phosphatidylinositol-3,4,5-trisphosphate-dependent Rac exchange factor 1 n=1 Tax=Astyanax mexicanus TaxID=7994 RepID=A0A8B9LKQ3_ASTMX